MCLFLLKNYIPYWAYIVYPITLFVVFLHEFGHSFFALLTWWWVSWVEINSDWSWFAITQWWWRTFVLMWGYIWSAIFWNILLYLWLKKGKYSEKVIYILGWMMIFTAIFWFNSIFSSIILFLVWVLLIVLAKYTKLDSYMLTFLWASSLAYIIQDFNVWPTSDLAKFADIFIFIPEVIWMYIWLIIVLAITFINFRYFIFRK